MLISVHFYARTLVCVQISEKKISLIVSVIAWKDKKIIMKVMLLIVVIKVKVKVVVVVVLIVLICVTMLMAMGVIKV